VSGKNNKILPIPETMQDISTSTESKKERSKKKNYVSLSKNLVRKNNFSFRTFSLEKSSRKPFLINHSGPLSQPRVSIFGCRCFTIFGCRCFTIFGPFLFII
jgi:hypothetical protein